MVLFLLCCCNHFVPGVCKTQYDADLATLTARMELLSQSQLQLEGKVEIIDAGKISKTPWHSCYQPKSLYKSYPHWSSPHLHFLHFGHSFAYDAPRIWNDLPDDVRSAKSLSSFRKKLKTYIFEKAYPPCFILSLHIVFSAVLTTAMSLI